MSIRTRSLAAAVLTAAMLVVVQAAAQAAVPRPLLASSALVGPRHRDPHIGQRPPPSVAYRLGHRGHCPL